MPKRNFPISLLIVRFTLLIALALVRDDLCSIQYQDGKKLLKGRLVLRSKRLA
ncbi:Hok/Gef family protein [Photobacterium profundum]|uniref:Hok/Gef family protein n=1 Tax=Photobacterium profundum TaxID=74109 RepID=UPI0018D3E575